MDVENPALQPSASETPQAAQPETGRGGLLRKRARSDKPRIHTLDELRGLALVAMIVYHTLYDLATMYGMPIGIGTDPWLIAFQRCICCTFILVSGVSARLSRNVGRRGCVVFGAAILLTLATVLFMPDFQILFGILHLLGLSMILFAFLGRPLAHGSPWVWFAVFLLLFILTFELPQGYVGIPGLIRFVLPQSLYRSEYLFFLGLPHPSFWSSDYFPLFPWFFLFLAGTSLGRFAEAGRFPAFTYKLRIRPLAFMGRHSLLIYLAHQPVIYGILLLLSKVFNLF